MTDHPSENLQKTYTVSVSSYFKNIQDFSMKPLLPRTDVAPKLTQRQQQILELIQRAVLDTGSPPTRAEIAAAFGFKSSNAAEEHLQALARKGVIELVGGMSRGIRLKAQDLKDLQQKQFERLELGHETLSLPLVGRVAAGAPMLAQEHLENTYKVERNLFQTKPDYLLKVKGMSMRDAGIIDGDLLAVKTVDQVKNGQIVVARLEQEVTVKRYFKTTQGIELRPENPDFSTIHVDTRQVFCIEGLVVGLIRNSLFH
jgi:repressor LexA